MPIFKCKMCGGSLEINNDETVAVCEYCGTKQTLPRLDDDRRTNMYDRANHFRRNNDYDKASNIYEQILNEDKTDSEAYWSLVLCQYGVEYVEDPSTHKRVPTVNRAQFTSIFDDDNYKLAIQYADSLQKTVYEEEATAINDIQKGILDISHKEEPFDVFICYKETDNNGRRTPDSVLATDLYHQLTQEGFKVFFSRITLEDKLGTAYEPYIFAALNSAKVMVVLGTKPEYFNAVWVKNEWSRYLSIVKQSNGKKVLIPAYKDMDPYDLPEEFSHLQAQDMSKLGFMQDLIRGIKKIISSNENSTGFKKENQTSSNINQLLKRAYMDLEDGEWGEANQLFEKVLNQDAECAEAYFGKLMADLKVVKRKKLGELQELFDDNRNYKRIIQFGNEEQKAEALGYIETIKNRQELAAKKKQENFQRIKAFRKRNDIAQNLIFMQRGYIVGLKTDGTVASIRKPYLYNDDINFWTDIISVSVGGRHTVGLKSNGTVVAVGDNEYGQCDVGSWKGIISVSAGEKHTVGLKSNGTVVAVGDNEYGQCDVGSWTDIKYLSAGGYWTIGVKTDGTVVVTGNGAFGLCDVSSWTDIVSADVGCRYVSSFDKRPSYYIIGLKSDGTVVMVDSDTLTSNYVDSWTDIVSITAGGNHVVGLKSDGTVVGTCCSKYGSSPNVDSWTDIVSISTGYYHTVGLKSDGTVVREGSKDNFGRYDTSSWKDIVSVESHRDFIIGVKANGTIILSDTKSYDRFNWFNLVSISSGNNYIAGLKSDGTVVVAGKGISNSCEVSSWKDIVSIIAGSGRMIGIKSNGTVVTTENAHIYSWKDIVSASTGPTHTVGVKSDGTVALAFNHKLNRCDVSSWTDIISVSVGEQHTVGLKSDGTVVAVGHKVFDIQYGEMRDDGTSEETPFEVGYANFGQCDVDSWTDIAYISVGYYHTVGLRLDGTVLAVGHNKYGQCDVSSWTDVVAINAGAYYTIGIKSDGTILCSGYDKDDCVDYSKFKLFNSIDTLKQERIDEMGKKGNEMKQQLILMERKKTETIANLSHLNDKMKTLIEQKKTEKAEEALRIRLLEEKEQKINQLIYEKSNLQFELSNLKGLFTGKKRREIEEKIENIDQTIAELNN